MESAEPDKGVMEELLGGPQTDPQGRTGTQTGGSRGQHDETREGRDR
jgi:cytochrome c oxidase subunit 1